MKKTRILIADDHVVVRMGLKTMLGYEPDMEIVGEAENGREAVNLSRKLKLDICILDLMMPEMNGAEATQAILEANPKAKVLIITSFVHSADLALAIQSGASGALMKESSAEEMIAAIHTVAGGGQAFSPDIKVSLTAEQPTVPLTGKQADIMQSVTRGLNNADIALQLGISRNSVKKHLTAIFKKLGVANRAEAIAIALRKQLLKI